MWTFEFYEKLVRTLEKKGYSFSFFGEKSGRDAYLRHDIDVSIDLALEFAQFEKEIGVKSSYFVMLEADAYNPFSKRSRDQLTKILELGHDIGLHYFMYDDNRIAEQAHLLSKLLDYKVRCFSIHKPASLKLDVTNLQVPGLINAYDPNFFSKEAYVSDSNHHFRVEDPIRFIEECQCDHFQLLTHPLWWANEGLDLNEKRLRLNNININIFNSYLIENIKVFI